MGLRSVQLFCPDVIGSIIDRGGPLLIVIIYVGLMIGPKVILTNY